MVQTGGGSFSIMSNIQILFVPYGSLTPYTVSELITFSLTLILLFLAFKDAPGGGEKT